MPHALVLALLLAPEAYGPPLPAAAVTPTVAVAGRTAEAPSIAAGPSAPVVTLEACLAYALDHQPALAAEQARVDQSRALVAQARASQAPAVSGSVGVQWQDKLAQQTAKLQGTSHLDTAVDLSLVYSVYAGGRWEWRSRAAVQGLSAAQYHREAVLQQVLTGVARAYGELWLREQVVEARGMLLTQAEAHHNLARQGAAVGRVAPVEVMRAEVNVATARDALRRAVRERDAGRLRLDQAMGREPEAPLTVTAALPGWPSPAVPAAEVWRGHPEWLRLAAQVRQAEAQVRAARADRGPDVVARGGFAAEGLTNLPPGDNWFAGLELRLPLFDGGRLRALADQARAGLALATAQLEAFQQALVTDVRDAQTALADAVARRQDLAATTTLAQQTLAIAEERYRVGAAIPLEVFDAQAALLQVRLAVSQAEADVFQAYVQLALALGQRLVPVAEGGHE